MEFYLTTTIDHFFKTAELREEFNIKAKQKISEFITNGYFRIKPIKQLKDKDYQYYELKLHFGKADYRLAFAQRKQVIIFCYLSKQLEKHKFDKEVQKWWKLHQAEVNEAVKL